MKPGRFFAILILCVTVVLAPDALAGGRPQSQIQPLTTQAVISYAAYGERDDHALMELSALEPSVGEKWTHIHELPSLQQEEGTVNGYDETSGNENAADQETMTLQEYLERDDGTWFPTGKKEYTVNAMMVSKETSFHNDLEVADYTVTDDGITVILKGSFDEMWASNLDKVMKTYTKPDGSTISEEDFARKDSWIEIITKPESDTYYAMFVPLNLSVTVETAWGDVLHTNLPNAPHGDGDYLVCRAAEDGKPDLTDIWVVNGVVFPEYYDTDTGN